MNDDLNLLVSYISKEQDLIKIAMNIKGGLNSREWEDHEYYRDPKILEFYKNNLPEHIANDIDYIVEVIGINSLHIIKNKEIK